MQAVELAPAAEAVGALEEFVAEAGTHFGGVRGDVAGVAEVETLGVIAADDHGESILKAERLGDFEIEPFGVTLPDPTVNVAGGGRTPLLVDRGCRRLGSICGV